jgi:hypothetical protein
VNIGLRFLFWGKLGNYPFVRTDYANFYWDALWANARLLLAPVNRALLGALVAQAVGLLCSLIALGGLAVYGRPARRLLALAAVWEVAALVPVLNNGVGPDDLLQGRYLYLPATGYCLAVASLLYTAAAAPRARVAVAGLARALLAGGVALSARQLEPFQGATRVVADIDAKMHRLIPYAPRPQGMAWYVEDPPISYQGAYVLPLGLGSTPAFARDEAFTTIVDDAQQAPLAADSRDAFAIRFGPTRRTPRYDIDYIAGITAAAEPPRATEAGTGLRVWDFRSCGAPAAEWRAEVAGVPCAPGQGLALAAGRALDGPVLSVAVPRNAIRFVRIRAEVTYGAEGGGQAAHSWWWKGDQADWSATRSCALAIRADGRAHVYWTLRARRRDRPGAAGPALHGGPRRGRGHAGVGRPGCRGLARRADTASRFRAAHQRGQGPSVVMSRSTRRACSSQWTVIWRPRARKRVSMAVFSGSVSAKRRRIPRVRASAISRRVMAMPSPRPCQASPRTAAYSALSAPGSRS